MSEPETDRELIEKIWHRSDDVFRAMLLRLDTMMAVCDLYLALLLQCPRDQSA